MNNHIIKINSSCVFHQLECNPFVFYEYVQEESNNNVYDYWLARNDYIKDKCKGDFFDSSEIEVALGIIQLPGSVHENDEYEVYLRPISTKSLRDVSALIASFIVQRKRNGRQPLDKDSSYKELLWFLYHCDWSAYLVTKALDMLDENDREIVFQCFSQICFCLTQEKQNKIENICSQYGYEYKIFKPEYLEDAYYTIFPQSILPKASYENCSSGLFDIVAAINGDDWFWINFDMSFINLGVTAPVFYDINRLKDVDSPLINVARWLNDLSFLSSYNDMILAFWLYSPHYQIKCLQHYFHDVSTGASKFDVNIIRKIYNSRDSHFGTFWLYLFEPFEKKEVGIKSVLDKILKLPFIESNCSTINEEQLLSIYNILEG